MCGTEPLGIKQTIANNAISNSTSTCHDTLSLFPMPQIANVNHVAIVQYKITHTNQYDDIRLCIRYSPPSRYLAMLMLTARR